MDASALRAELEQRAVPDKKLPELLAGKARVPGTAVFLVSHSGFVPTALLRNLEHNKVYHEKIVILHIEIQRIPRVDPLCRVTVDGAVSRRVRRARELRLHGNAGRQRGVAQMRGARGSTSSPRIPRSSSAGTWCGRGRVPGIAGLKSRAFAFLQRRSAQAAEFFHMPTRGVVVLATDIELW